MQKKTGIVVLVVLLMVIVTASSIALMAGKNSENDAAPPATTNRNQSDTAGLGNGAVVDAVATTEVAIQDYAYAPEIIKIKVGDTVTWTNNDTVQHDVKSEAGLSEGPMSELLAKGETYNFTFMEAGTYNYYCSPHPYMKGTVIVE